MAKSEQHFLKLFNNNLVGMIITDEDHIIVDINDKLLELSELERNEVIGKTGLEINILNEKFVRETWQEIQETGRVMNKEFSFNTKSNKKVYGLFSTEPIELEGIKYHLTTLVDISRRKKTEFALSNIYERVTDAFVAIDTNWCYTYVNKKAGELLEKDPACLVGKHIWTEFPEDIDQPVYISFHEAMEKQEMVMMEEYYEPYDRWFQNIIYPSPDGLSVFFSDITNRKKAEDKIRESELRFRTLTRNAPVGIFETNAEGLTTYVNETWMEFTGMSFDEALGDGWEKATHPDDHDSLMKRWHDKSSKAKPSESEYRLIDKAGKQRWVNGNAVPVVKEDGSVSGYIGTITDVTELKKAMQLIQKSEEALSKAQQISKIGNWEFNLFTGELFWSDEQYRIFELVGEPAETLFEAYKKKYHPGDLIKLDEVIKNAIEKKKGYTYEHRMICNDGSIKYILSIGEVIIDDLGHVVGIKGTGQDITERKLVEEILTERTNQLKELSGHLQNIREDERMNIAREIHDELGQQLTGLKMDIAWLMKKIGQDDPVIKDKFNDVLLLVDGTVKSIRRIATELRPSVIDDLGLNAAMEWLVGEFSERLNIDIEFRNSFDDKEVKPALSIGLFRILQESLTNIAKHANAKGAVITFENINGVARLSIQDNGVGFNNVAKQNESSFGLLGIKERTSMMNGECAVFSKPGEGTKIEISIPLG